MITREEQAQGLHPWAWWGWAAGLAVAAAGTTNPLLLCLLAAVLVVVVLARRGDAPWARSLRAYLVLGGVVVTLRLLVAVTIGVHTGRLVVFRLPTVPLPAWAAGIRLGGVVTAEMLCAALYAALQLAVMLLAVGAANSLASPRQALRSVPAALYEVSVAVVIALAVAPQLVQSAGRVRRARRLRGGAGRGVRAVTSLVVPVFADAVERSVALATGMQARGFGRTRGATARAALPAMLASGTLAVLGMFLLVASPWPVPATAAVALGVAGTAWGLRRAGRRLHVTRYRRPPWRGRETTVACAGLLAGVVVLVAAQLDPATLGAAAASLLGPAAYHPVADPLGWPSLAPSMLLVIVLGVVPLAVTRPTTTIRPTVTRPTTTIRPTATRPTVTPAGAVDASAAPRADRRVRSPRPRADREAVAA
ncbi:MAG: energy-coupling factor transporter transmembrane protein EcfT [Micrococcales bacterium]|nr:energy-coupling factor transporter transmembrane protein EcfT [Micrococcales bacterium]